MGPGQFSFFGFTLFLVLSNMNCLICLFISEHGLTLISTDAQSTINYNQDCFAGMALGQFATLMERGLG